MIPFEMPPKQRGTDAQQIKDLTDWAIRLVAKLKQMSDEIDRLKAENSSE